LFGLIPSTPSGSEDHFETLLPLAVNNEINLCLSGKQSFNPKVIASIMDRRELFEKIVNQVYP
jgi:hypothetical protein